MEAAAGAVAQAAVGAQARHGLAGEPVGPLARPATLSKAVPVLAKIFTIKRLSK